jgi:hypothetical protein
MTKVMNNESGIMNYELWDLDIGILLEIRAITCLPARQGN